MSPKPVSPNHESEEAAALYALEALEIAERDSLRQALAESRKLAQTKSAQTKSTQTELAKTVEDFTQTVAELPYGLPQMPLPDTLKGRLFERITQEVVAQDSELYQLLKLSIDELKRKSEALSWVPLKGGTADACVATLAVDETCQKLAFYAKADKGGFFPRHAHDSGETVLVLAGDFVVDGVRYQVGDRLESIANSDHQPETTDGCLVFCISSLKDELLD